MNDRPTCPATKRDRFATVHQCAEAAGHDGYHETSDGFLFAEPSWEVGLRVRRYPVRSVRYDGETLAGIRELAEVVGIDDLGDKYRPLSVRLNNRPPDRILYPGEYLVQFSDGLIEHRTAERADVDFKEAVHV